MEKTNLLTLVVMLTVGIILAGSLLMPVLSEYTTATQTYYNDGIPYAAPDEDTHIIVISSDGAAFTITTDGETCETPDLTLYGSATIVYCSDISLRLFTTGEVSGEGKNSLGTVSKFTLGTVDSDTSVTITITGDDATSGSYTFSDVRAYISTEGAYVLCSTPKVNEDSDIMIIGGTTTKGGIGTYSITGIGTVDDFEAKIVRGNGTVEATSVNVTNVDGNLSTVDQIVIDVTYNSNDYQTTYTYFLAPHEVTYTPGNYLGANNAALLAAIPILVIVGILMVGVSAIVVKNRD